jgi:CRP-like cAMP-binding protein
LVGVYEVLSLRVGEKIFTSSPLFANMTPYQVRKAILLTELRPFHKGERVLEQGTEGSDMYLVLSGEVSVSLRQGDRTISLATLGEGAVMGEVGFVRAQERTASVDALSDGEMLVFNAEKVRRNMRLYPHIASKLNLNIAAILGERLVETTGRLHQAPQA